MAEGKVVGLGESKRRREHAARRQATPAPAEAVAEGAPHHDPDQQPEALRRQLCCLELLQAITAAANRATSCEAVYRYALEQIGTRAGWQAGHAYLVAQDGSDVAPSSDIWYVEQPERFARLRRGTDRTPIVAGVGLAGRVLSEGRPVWLPDLRPDDLGARAGIGEALGLKSGVAFPVRIGADVVAVFELFSTEPHAVDEQLLAVLGQVGVELGRVAERSRADATLRRAYDELWQANGELTREIGERTSAEAKLTRLAFYDTLTGLPNRALFLDRLDHALTRADRNHRGVGLMFLDLDHFKAINDTLGHDAGDQLLQVVAGRLRAGVRAGDTVARFAGDEFTILLEDLDARADAVTVAQRIIEAIREPVLFDGTEIVPSTSIGIVFGVSGRDQPDKLLRHADLAMYRAKVCGRGCFEIFDPTMTTSAMERLELEADLRRALERQELRIHYQPIVSLETGKIVAVEALTRWEHSERGMVDPAQFVLLAEETGLIVPLGKWVLEEACRQVRRWQMVYPEAGRLVMSVNLTARQFQDPHLVDEVGEVLREIGLDPACLQFEVTETSVMRDAEATVRTLHDLKALGVQLAIDDFGTGYASATYLQQFPVDTLKVDRSFIEGLGREIHDTELVRNIISMAKNLSLAVCSEGVETAEQLTQLRAMGCDRGQGYFFSPALPPEGFTAALWHETERRLHAAPGNSTSAA